MRKPLIVGNWKMYKTITEAVDYVDQIKDALPDPEQEEVELAVPTLFWSRSSNTPGDQFKDCSRKLLLPRRRGLYW